MQRPVLTSAFVASAMLLAVACRTSNNPRGRWAYGISREAYADDANWMHVGGISDPYAIVFIPVMYATPFMLDTVALPVTLWRDAMYP